MIFNLSLKSVTANGAYCKFLQRALDLSGQLSVRYDRGHSPKVPAPVYVRRILTHMSVSLMSLITNIIALLLIDYYMFCALNTKENGRVVGQIVLGIFQKF